MDQQQLINELVERHGNFNAKLSRIMDMVETLQMDAQKARNPDYDTKTLTATGQQWVMEHRERKHVFVYTTSATITLTANEWVYPLTQNNWTNVEAPDGVKFTVSGACTLQIKFTDEVVP